MLASGKLSFSRLSPKVTDVGINGVFAPTSVKNQRFLPPSPEGEGFGVFNIERSINWDFAVAFFVEYGTMVSWRFATW